MQILKIVTFSWDQKSGDYLSMCDYLGTLWLFGVWLFWGYTVIYFLIYSWNFFPSMIQNLAFNELTKYINTTSYDVKIITKFFLLRKPHWDEQLIETEKTVLWFFSFAKLWSSSELLNPHTPVAQKVADEVVFWRFEGEEVHFFNRTSLTPTLRFLMRTF